MNSNNPTKTLPSNYADLSLDQIAQVMEDLHNELASRKLHLRPTLLTQAQDLRAVRELRRGLSRIRGAA